MPIPYRIDLAGGWLDQPFVSKLCSGYVVNLSLKATQEFSHRSGMATSTRDKAMVLWGNELPIDRYGHEKTAKILFGYENAPGEQGFVTGSQDAIGIVFPGLHRLYYNGGYWPEHIVCNDDMAKLYPLEESLRLVPLAPRHGSVQVIEGKRICQALAMRLANAANQMIESIESGLGNLAPFGSAMIESFWAQVALFPKMVNNEIISIIDQYHKRCHGYKLSGAGGGGYLVLVTHEEIEGSIRIKINS